LLDSIDGKFWLQMEVRALAAALRQLGEGTASWREAAADALAFRSARYALATEQERERERLLDVKEGMAEYSAWRLSGARPEEVAGRVTDLPHGDTATWVRHFPYCTGPAYGYLLDAACADPATPPAMKEWRQALRTTPDLQKLLASVVPAASTTEAESRSERYGASAVRADEERRERERQTRMTRLRERFVQGPVVRIKPPRRGPYTFIPSQVTPLEVGTVYRSFEWRGDDGSELVVEGEALLTPDFAEVWVPLDPAHAPSPPETTPATVTGDGWTLRLAAGWRFQVEGGSWIVQSGR